MSKPCLIILLSFLICMDAESQCTAGGASWTSGATSGSMNATGVIAGVNIVNVRTVGTMTGGRPFYSIGSSSWKGLNYASLWLSRAYSSFGSNYTSYKLQTPMDSNSIHLRVDNIRGDIFNWETQRIRGFNNGVPVLIDFKDPVNGAYITGGNTINGGSTTTSAVQSSMRAFFRSAVDSIVVQQVSNSDWIIAELMVQCEYILPLNLSSFSATETNSGVRLEWKNSLESEQLLYMEAEHSVDGRQWVPLGRVSPVGQGHPYSLMDNNATSGVNFYRIKYAFLDGRTLYTAILRINRAKGGLFLCAVFPNPAKEQFTVSFSENVQRAVIFNAEGRTIKILHTVSGTRLVNTTSWKQGIYFLQIETLKGEQITRKIFRH